VGRLDRQPQAPTRDPPRGVRCDRAAQAKGTELVLVEHGRPLQTSQLEMEELAKVRRIIDRLAPSAAGNRCWCLNASQGRMAFAAGDGLRERRRPHRRGATSSTASARGGVALAWPRSRSCRSALLAPAKGIGELRRSQQLSNSFEALLATEPPR